MHTHAHGVKMPHALDLTLFNLLKLLWCVVGQCLFIRDHWLIKCLPCH